MDLPLGFRELGQVDYQPTWHAMQRFTDSRGADTPDEIWLLEHAPVFTQGQAGKAEHNVTLSVSCSDGFSNHP